MMNNNLQINNVIKTVGGLMYRGIIALVNIRSRLKMNSF
jgi:hypothetical protein